MADPDEAQAFAERMTGLMNEGMLALTVSIGHELGLFDTLAKLPPSTSAEIAAAAGLDERYVREWLGAMVCGGIVTYASEGARYALPAEHAACTTAAAGPDNIAAFVHSSILLADRRHEVMAAFRNGGGVPYERYDDFLALWAGQNRLRFERALLDQLPQVIPDIDRALSDGIDVLEVGCGEGHALNVLAKAYPNSRFTGYDLRENAITEANERARELGNQNVSFEVRDLATLEDSARWALVLAFDVIHDQAKPREVLRLVREALTPDGTFLMVDIHAASDPGANRDHPAGPFLYGTSLLHCMTVSLAYQGEGLGAVWGEAKARELLTEAGFSQVEVKLLEGDAFNAFFAARA